jgi:hypothetical protein
VHHGALRIRKPINAMRRGIDQQASENQILVAVIEKPQRLIRVCESDRSCKDDD